MLTVLNVAYPLAPLGPDAVGGAEQVLALLDAALVRAGHRSIVVASEDSEVRGVLVATPRIDGPLGPRERAAAARCHRAAIRGVLAAWSVDVVHMHGIDFHRYLPPPGPPVLATLHLPPAWYPPAALRPTRPRTYLHCVSESQHRACPAGTALLPPIPNGVRLDAFAGRHARRGFALALGRICPEKGFHLALDAARRAGIPLLVAGRVFHYDAHERYLRDEILPRLDAERRLIGPLDPTRKRRILGAARCVLVPSLAPETSSLVAMEALAAGTPVVAFAAGALAEIVEPGRTGFLVRGAHEMADAIHAAAALDPEACRAAARERFSAERTVERYLALYHQLAGERRGDGAERVQYDGTGPAADAPEPPTMAPKPPTTRRTSRPPARTPPIEIEELTTLEALEALRPAWTELWRGVLTATPFQSPQWLIPWWRHFRGEALRVLALRRAGRLVGVAPLYILCEPGSGLRRLLPLGIGNSDYLDPLLEPEAAAPAANAVLAWICAHADDWHRCELPQLRPDSALLAAVAPHGTVDRIAPAEPCPVLALPATAAALEDALPPGMRDRIRYAVRRAGRTGTIEVEAATPHNLDALFDALLEVHRARWADRGRTGVLDDDAVLRFHREAAPGLLSLGALRLYLLRIDGRPAAAYHGFLARTRAYYYLGGFDPAFRRLGAGNLVVWHAIREAAREGAREFDFLRGREPYKYAWGAHDRPTYARRLHMRGARKIRR
ncbi:MAG TPA: GNAT family N-acetyltransferase [Longimicrobiales bacterium]